MSSPDFLFGFIDSQIPAELRAYIPGAFKLSYQAVDRVLGENLFMQTRTAKMALPGDLLAVAAEFAIESLCNQKIWPFRCAYKPYAKPTGYHLEVYTGNAILTLSQMADTGCQPRKAIFRRNLLKNNAPFLPLEGFEDEPIDEEQAHHLILAHGYREFGSGYPMTDRRDFLRYARG